MNASIRGPTRMRAEVGPSRLLEREDDLAPIEGDSRARDGRARVVVEGPAGVGKTALLADTRAMASRRDAGALAPRS